MDPTFAGILADVVTFIHLCYMGYVVFGQLLIMIGWPLGRQWIRNPWFRGTHLAMILIVALEALVEFKCPLTVWERELRLAAEQTINGIDVEGISFTGQLMRRVQFAAEDWPEWENTTFYVAAALIVATAILVPPRFRKKTAPADVPVKV